uniref:Uncharacterized protein n=1 Tax=Panagrolaimus sp. ES5 TaxID=591445 RepID=A0AC34GPA9_9BILA
MNLLTIGIFACLFSSVLSWYVKKEDSKVWNPKEIQQWYSQPKTWFPHFWHMQSASNSEQGKPWFLQTWYYSAFQPGVSNFDQTSADLAKPKLAVKKAKIKFTIKQIFYNINFE